MNIPPSLLNEKRWICWRYIERDGKRTKVPFQPTGVPAKSNDSNTWYAYEHVRAALGFDGIGILLGGGLVGIDLDHVVGNGHADTAASIIREINSYTELSPSKTGYHILAWGKLPDGGRKREPVECYDRGRFFTFTGLHVDGTPKDVQNRQGEITAWHLRTFPPPPPLPPPVPVTPLDMDDAALIALACRGYRFDKLWRGDMSEYGNDKSRADYALCHSLAFWTQGDAARVDRLFRMSGLMRAKWERRAGQMTYGQLTVSKACQRQNVYFDPTPKTERKEPTALDRELTRTEAPLPEQTTRPSVEDARASIFLAMWDYYESGANDLLLIRAAPGVGKTTEAVKFCSALCADGQRVKYAMPRHDFFENILSLQAANGLATTTYEWLPRQDKEPQTCRYAEAITAWMQRGYTGIRFCIGVCGGDTMKNECPYHAQAKRTEALICAQHAHVTSGHPLEFNYDLGDESPLGAFLNKWRIKTDDIVSAEMEAGSGLYKIYDALRTVSRYEQPMQGRALFDEIAKLSDLPLSGMVVILETAQLPPDAEPQFNTPHSADEAEHFPVWHLPKSLPLLLREARRYAAGQDAIRRVYAGGNHLGLLLRNAPADGLSDRLIWLDATANERIYRALFGRPVKMVDAYPSLQGRVYQVWNRANGISTLRDVKGQSEQDAKARKTKREQTLAFVKRVIAQRGYSHPAVITFKDLEGFFLDIPGVQTGHFGGARGTNDFIECDACFVVGTPMPNLLDVVSIAAQVFFERDDPPFDARWTSKPLRYHYQDANGNGWEYPVSGYWHDDDLQAIVEQHREDEILQAAHRVRPILHEVDVWLMTNIPIADLPPTELVDMNAILTHRPGQRFETSEKGLAAVRALSAHGPYTRAEFERASGLSRMTARKVFDDMLLNGIIIKSGENVFESKEGE